MTHYCFQSKTVSRLSKIIRQKSNKSNYKAVIFPKLLLHISPLEVSSLIIPRLLNFSSNLYKLLFMYSPNLNVQKDAVKSPYQVRCRVLLVLQNSLPQQKIVRILIEGKANHTTYELLNTIGRNTVLPQYKNNLDIRA